MAEGTPPGAAAAAELGLAVEVMAVGPSPSMEAHEAKLGVEAGSLCKTLIVRRADDDYAFVVVSGGRKMDWKKIRSALGVSRISMATREQVAEVTGYVPGTVTVLGSARPLPVVVDTIAAGFDRIAVGSGHPGTSLLVDTADYIRALDAQVLDVTSGD